MIPLFELVRPECIRLELSARRKADALRELAGLLEQAGRIKDRRRIEEGLLQRERTASTGIGNGVAIPHLLTSETRETVMAFGRRREGIRFDAVDDLPVTLIFLIVGPREQEYAHLQLLSRLSRLLHSHTFRQALLEAETQAEVLRLLRREEEAEA